MAHYQAKVLVRLRPSVLDPAGEASRAASKRLGIDGINKLRIGKLIELELEAPDEQEAKKQLEILKSIIYCLKVKEQFF